MVELSENYSIWFVTHSMQQAARVSRRTAFFHLGDIIEVGETNEIFVRPGHQLTEDYITGRVGVNIQLLVLGGCPHHLKAFQERFATGIIPSPTLRGMRKL